MSSYDSRCDPIMLRVTIFFCSFTFSIPLLFSAHLWICLYILSHWLSRDSGAVQWGLEIKFARIEALGNSDQVMLYCFVSFNSNQWYRQHKILILIWNDRKKLKVVGIFWKPGLLSFVTDCPWPCSTIWCLLSCHRHDFQVLLKTFLYKRYFLKV